MELELPVIIHIYYNKGNNIFEVTTPLVFSIKNFGDCDNDNDIDILGEWYVHISNGNWDNNTPLPPVNLSYRMDNFDIILSWDNSTDIENNNGLTYNLEIGTSKNKFDIIEVLTSTTGKLRTPEMGNVQTNTSWRIKGLPEGTYYWRVQAIDQSFNGGKWTEIDSFLITKISPEFSFDTVCLGNYTSFIDKSTTTDSITGWKWIFADSTISTLQNPNHLFKLPGNHKVILWVYSASGDSVSLSKQVIVKPVPIPGFTVEPVCYGQPSLLINTSDTSLVHVKSWIWDLGNNGSSIQWDSISQPYSKTDTASITIIADNGCSGIYSHPVLVVDIPTALITYPPGYSNKVCSNSTDSTIIRSFYSRSNFSYYWRYNEIPLPEETNDSLIISSNAGSYTLGVSAKAGNTECFSDISQPVEIFVIQPSPTPEISDFPTNFCPLDIINVSVSPYDSIYKYEWMHNGNIIENTLNDTLNRILESGDYKVTASVNGQCPVASEVKTLEFKSDIKKPELVVFGPNVWYIGCKDTGDYFFDWFYNGQLIENEHDYICMVNQNLGEYYLVISDGTGCSALSDIITIPTVEYKSGFDFAPPGTLLIWPNPTKGVFTLEIIDSYIGVIEIEFLNSSGRLIKNDYFYKSNLTISKIYDLTQFPKGMYYIKVRIGIKEISNEIIIN